jgi:hypothetical protein
VHELNNQFVVSKTHILNDILFISYKDLVPIFFLGMVNVHGHDSTSWVLMISFEEEFGALVIDISKLSIPLVNNWQKLIHLVLKFPHITNIHEML